MKIGIAALVAVLVATPAFAATGDNPFSANSTVLDLRGLNLASVDGQQRLAIRMDQAADTVCGTGMSTIHLALAAQARACRADVVANIRARITAASASRAIGENAQLAQR